MAEEEEIMSEMSLFNGADPRALPAAEVMHAAISTEPLFSDTAREAVASEHCGAVVCFSGVVRNHDGGKGVASLKYSSHPTAKVIIRLVASEIAMEFPGVRIWVGHRVGALNIGDSALEAAVASAHRDQAFAACSALVERVKAEVPIWKEQLFADGTTEWVGV